MLIDQGHVDLRCDDALAYLPFVSSFPPRPFTKPAFVGPLDIDQRIAGSPSQGLVKGMFFSAIAEEASAASGRRVGRERYMAFRGYPLAEWLAFLPEAARAAYPSVHPKEGLRRFGHNAFAVLDQSVAGRVVLSMAARNLAASMFLASRIYQVIGSHGSLRVVVNDPGYAVLALRGLWDYIDSWHVESSKELSARLVQRAKSGIESTTTPMAISRSPTRCEAGRWAYSRGIAYSMTEESEAASNR